MANYKAEAEASKAAKRQTMGIELERPRPNNRMTDQECRDFDAEAWRALREQREDMTK